jgi:hypothetical protein
MLSREIRVQSYVSIAVGAIFFAVWIAVASGASVKAVDGLARLIACLAFVGIGVLGLTTARGVRDLEERVSRLEPSVARGDKRSRESN